MATRKRGSIAVQLKRGKKLFYDFSGHNGDVIKLDPIDKPTIPEVICAVGSTLAIEYETVRDGKVERYRHEFAAHARPLLCTSYDGRQLIFVGGQYDFTECGITDRKK